MHRRILPALSPSFGETKAVSVIPSNPDLAPADFFYSLN
jgi:hypothetical protein